jgi:hypothetical protein
MTQRIFNCLVILLAFAPVVSCNDDDEEVKTFSAVADISETSIADEKYNMVVVYSTDGGNTFVDYPVVKMGETYQAMVVHRTADGDISMISGRCFAFDWSASDPQPTDAHRDKAEFVLGNNNALSVRIVDTDYGPFDPTLWTGHWIGDEDGDCCSSSDENNIRRDSSDPNKFIMDNFWGDHVDAYIVFQPSTNPNDQIVTLPEQTTSEGGVAKGTGTYDQCAGTFTLATSYTIGGDTYEFDYHFHR